MTSTPGWLDLEAWPWRPRWHQGPEGALHYVAEGRGPTLLLVHGTPTWSFEWRHVIRALCASHRVIAVDHLGFGLSERPASAAYRPEDHARRFEQFFEAVIGDDPCSVVVHDFGGPIALPTLYRRASQVRCLVAVNSWCWNLAGDPALRRQIAAVQGWLGRQLYRHANASQRLLMPMAYGDRAKLTASIHRQYRAVFPTPDDRERVLYALARSLWESAGFFDAVWAGRGALADVPVRVGWGARDGALPSRLVEQWCVGFPAATVTRFDREGHWPHEEAPETFERFLRHALGGEAHGLTTAAARGRPARPSP